MEIKIFTLCDYAQDVGGKLTIVGTFDTVFYDKLPAFVPTCTVLARIQFNQSEDGKHSVKLEIMNEGERKEFMPPFKTDIEVKIPQGEEWAHANFLIGINGIKFPLGGIYRYILSIDGSERDSLLLKVKERPRKSDEHK